MEAQCVATVPFANVSEGSNQSLLLSLEMLLLFCVLVSQAGVLEMWVHGRTWGLGTPLVL